MNQQKLERGNELSRRIVLLQNAIADGVREFRGGGGGEEIKVSDTAWNSVRDILLGDLRAQLQAAKDEFQAL